LTPRHAVDYDAFEGKAGCELFGISHIVIVFIVALLVFGPEKLPELARQLGRALSDFRRASMDFRRMMEEELQELERQTQEKQRLAAAQAASALQLPEPAGSVAVGTLPPPESDSPPAGEQHAGTAAETPSEDDAQHS
jgi:sec-independent protein translocase protein TatB